MGKISKLVSSVAALKRELGRANLDPQALPKDPPKPLRIGLALGGGFARGLAHIGVLKAFEEN